MKGQIGYPVFDGPCNVNDPCGITNHGIMELNGNSADTSGTLSLNRGGFLINECSGIIRLNGGEGQDSGSLLNRTSDTQGSGTITNHGSIEKFNNAVFDNQGIIEHSTPSIIPNIVDNNSGTIEEIASTCSITVDIDIKPGSDPNCFNNDGHGVIPVAILGSNTFDVTYIDTTTITLDGQETKTKGNGDPQVAIEDVNNDGFDDMVVKIIDLDGTYAQGDGNATLSGNLLDGTEIKGTDSICITQ